MKDTIDNSNVKHPEGFTLKLALADAIPVILFSITVSLLSLRFSSPLFRAGSFLIILAGALKVIWKIFMAYGKNYKILAKQLRYVMPFGFLLQLLSVILDLFVSHTGTIRLLCKNALTMPSLLFFLLGIATMFGMIYMAKHADQLNAKSNAKEQAINSFMQLMFLLGVYFIK